MISNQVALHVFTTGHTIEAVIKKENQHCVTKEELEALLVRFAELNNGMVPRIGTIAKIPLLEKYILPETGCVI